MKYLFSKLPEIKSQIKNSKRAALLLDFDGTLSAIVPKPEDACLTEKTRQLLKSVDQTFPVVIVTGRPLAVIRKKVGVKHFIYAASHGLEWSFDGQYKRKPLPKQVMEKLNRFRQAVKNIKNDYPDLIIEEKPLAITFHYHSMPIKRKKIFAEQLKNFLKPIYKQSSIKIFRDKETVEILPDLNWTKGDIVKLALKHLRQKNHKNFLPIYIGDAATDEDAFHALARGITIRVGKTKNSSAAYYAREQREVRKFLAWIKSLASK